MDPGKLTDLRSALVNNITLASIIVRNKIHKFILYENYLLSETIEKFVDYQQSKNNQINDQTMLLETDDECGSEINVPKVLGDIFESIIGAVFLDTGLCLKQTWKIIYELMRNEIHKFMENVPLQIVRRLFEWHSGKAEPKFYASELIEGDDNVAVPLEFNFNGDKKILVGIGKNRKIAKIAAAKKALRLLES
jgi:endoribonuclease Dicer